MANKIAAAMIIVGIALLPGTIGAAVGRGPAGTDGVAAADPDCWHTFHARPTKTGYYVDPCATRSSGTNEFPYHWVEQVRWYWSCAPVSGCSIQNVQGLLQTCVRSLDSGDETTADAVSVNVAVTKELLAHSLVRAARGQCSTILTPALSVKGCGSTDRPLGVYPQVVSVLSQGRGTMYQDGETPWRIPGPTSLFSSSSSSYLVGRGGRCK